MSWTDPKVIVDLLQFLLMGLISLVLWVRKPGEDSAKAVQAESEERTRQMAELATRITRIEETLEHMPTDKELAKLDGSLRESNARIEAVQAMMSRQGNQLDMIQRFLQESQRP